MMKKLLHNTLTAAACASMLLVGACASNTGVSDTIDEPADQVVQVRPEEAGQSASVVPAPGPAKIDSDGNVYSSSAAPGSGNHATVGTNTNVNLVPERSRVDVTHTTMASSTTLNDQTALDNTATLDTTTRVETPTLVESTPNVSATVTRTETTTVPMTSSAQETTRTTTTTTEADQPAPTRTRMRKD